MSEVARLRAFLKLGRPHFLIGGLLLFALGSALAAAEGVRIDWHRYAWGQATVTAAQWMTHYSNDYFDLEADRANGTPTRWSGGSRVLVSGAVTPRAALAASAVLAVLALLAACALDARPGSPRLALPLSLLIIVLSWCYSAPPVRLLSRGLGEVTTALVVTLLTPLLGYFVQRGELRPSLFLACAPLCCLQFSMLLTIELPDAVGDAAQGKQTLVVRHGAAWAARCSAALLIATFGSLPALFLLGLPPRVAACAALPAPLAVWQTMRLAQGAFRDPKRWEGLALCSVALLVTTTLAELIGATLTAMAAG
jgi:1,4-dihydroxy-2-naphthoate polyprenyltransferase